MSVIRVVTLMAMSLLVAPVAPTLAQVENQDYQKIVPAQESGTPGKMEVIEFFSYGCPHCYQMQPLITQWAKSLPADVVLVKVPVSFGRKEWGQLSRAYYTLESLGALPRLDAALFEAIHRDKLPLFDEDHLAAWAGEHGVDANKFRAEFNSFNVTTKASRAEQMSRNYKVQGVPYITVDGKYAALGKTYEDMLKTARVLIDKSASEKQAANR
jgi:thiol:disulfide interchange protein DsbA